jgi:dolichyl-diphosphooligosaccharide--protein glycosyltransferase
MDRQDWLALADRYGPTAGLAIVVVFMTWIRIADRADVFGTEGLVYLSGNDAWYHARIVTLIVDHFPATQRFDAWSYFPYGTGRHSGFGGLFDQLIALGALIVGAGSPSPETVDTVVAYAPVAFGALTAVPAYLIGKRLTDRWGGLLTAGLLSLFSGQFLSRTAVGAADHQSSEAFFGTLAFAGFIYAMRTGYAEKPTVADIRDRNWVVLRRPLVASLLGGVAIASYLMTWPPGVAFVFTIGVFVLLQIVRDHLNGRPTEYLAITTATTMLPAGVLTLVYAKDYGLSATSFSLLQPLVVFGIGGGAVLLYGISAYAHNEGYGRRAYPAIVGGIIAGVLVVSFLVFPRTTDLFESLFVRMYSYGTATTQEAGTVGEIQPARSGNALSAFGYAFYLAAVGFAILLARAISRNRPTELLVVLWSFSTVSAYFTMIRFGYYFAVNVALLSAFTIWWTAGVLELGEIDALRDVETYQILGIALLVVLVAPANVVAWDTTGNGRINQPNWEQTEGLAGANVAWQEELTWMRDNTPDPRSSGLAYDELTAAPENGDFAYPENAYGVMSWWDYGHWITRTGERIPNANPFQEGPRPASAFLLAQSEERANLILEALPSMRGSVGEISPTEATGPISNADLRAMIANQSAQRANETTRYVMIDDQMAAYKGISRRSSGKFGPITQWTGPATGTYELTRNRTIRTGNGTTQVPLPGLSERYENTMLSRLYFGDATGLEQYRLVHETERSTTFLSLVQQSSTGEYQSIGRGITNAVLTPRLQRALQQNPNLVPYDIRTESRVKTFERVEGARLTGQVDPDRLSGPNATVLAQVSLRTETRNRTLTYRGRTTADENGSFSLTVPYPTDNSVPPAEGGTNASVRATGNYSVLVDPLTGTFNGREQVFGARASTSVDVPEPAIYNGSAIPVEFDPGYEPGSLNATLENDTIENGSTTTLSVTAGFTNDTTRDVTTAATLNSTNRSVATVAANGTVTANGTGTTQLDVSFRGETVSTNLTVASDPTYVSGSLTATLENDTIANDSTTNLTVTAAFTNGTTLDVTAAATLSATSPDVATIADDGTVTANSTGITQFNATFRGETDAAVLEVENASDGNTGRIDPLLGGTLIERTAIPSPYDPVTAGLAPVGAR